MKKIEIKSDFIKLDQFLKLSDVVMSGGEAKLIINDEKVRVNGEICTQRGKKIKIDDIVEVYGEKYIIK